MEKTWRKTDLKKWFYHGLFERPLLNRSVAIHYTTRFEQSESAWLGLRPPSFIVPNPVAMQEFQRLPVRGIFRATLKLPSAAQIVLYLGRVEHRKGIDLALKAFAQVSHQISEALFIIAGPSEDHFQETLEQVARELGVFEKVIFTGFLNQAQRLSAFADADVFILTSHSENFGMSVVEAMASRLPVVVSDTVGIAEDILKAQAGKVVPLQVALIAKALEDLLLSEELRKNLGERARSLAFTKYSCLDIAKAFDFQLKQWMHGPG
jgi:glycosyltransferase involved in cell wall biosynthesis